MGQYLTRTLDLAAVRTPATTIVSGTPTVHCELSNRGEAVDAHSPRILYSPWADQGPSFEVEYRGRGRPAQSSAPEPQLSTGATHRGEHARDGQQTHVRSHSCDRGAFVEPPPDTGRTKPDASDAKHQYERRDECPRSVASGQYPPAQEIMVARGMQLVVAHLLPRLLVYSRSFSKQRVHVGRRHGVEGKLPQGRGRGALRARRGLVARERRHRSVVVIMRGQIERHVSVSRRRDG